MNSIGLVEIVQNQIYVIIMNTSLCPDGFICKITDENQECKLVFFILFKSQSLFFNSGLATATFEGNKSSLIATLQHRSISKISNEISFRLRARPQHAHLLNNKKCIYIKLFFIIFISMKI